MATRHPYGHCRHHPARQVKALHRQKDVRRLPQRSRAPPADPLQEKPLRRIHLKEKPLRKGQSKQSGGDSGHEPRAVNGGGNLPPIAELKNWMCEILFRTNDPDDYDYSNKIGSYIGDSGDLRSAGQATPDAMDISPTSHIHPSTHSKIAARHGDPHRLQ